MARQHLSNCLTLGLLISAPTIFLSVIAKAAPIEPQSATAVDVEHIIRAWKDPEYVAALSKTERERLIDNPAGQVEVIESDENMQELELREPQRHQAITITHTIDVCCSTGDLPCNGNTQDLLCIVDRSKPEQNEPGSNQPLLTNPRRTP